MLLASHSRKHFQTLLRSCSWEILVSGDYFDYFSSAETPRGKLFRHENGTKTVITKLNTVHNATNTAVGLILGTLVVILLAANGYKT